MAASSVAAAERNLSKKEFSQKINHVVKKHNFHVVTFSKPTWCMHCSKFMYGLVHQGQICKACKYHCHSKCSIQVTDTCGDPLPKVKGFLVKNEEKEPENFASLARMVASAALQGISAEVSHHDMFIDCIKSGDKKMATYMIDKYINAESNDINMQDSLGNTALHYMAMGDFESDLILHTMKSPMLLCDVLNQDGNTPLHYLCAKFPTVDCIEVGEHLIDRGADVNRQNRNGETPLHKAVFNGRVRFLLAEMLIHHNADLNLVTTAGETALHYAVRLDREDLVEYLLLEGALPDVAAKNLKTPLALAVESHLTTLISVLKRAEEVTSFLRNINFLMYQKKFVEMELTRGNVLSSLNTSLLSEMAITDPVHRTTILQHKGSRRPSVCTELGKNLQQSILNKTHDNHMDLRGDNWIIQNTEVEFIKKLGSGASGTVFKGLFLGVEVAIKVVKKELATDIEDFVKEFMTMYKVRSPQVISLYGAILEPKLCLVMELAHMGSLHTVLRNPSFDCTWDSTISFALEAAEGMALLHALQPPLFHRDLKTLNLMVTNQLKIKVGDFGLSIFDNTRQSHKTEEVNGTAAYLAPEMLDGHAFTNKADVYAFAIVFWELANTTLKQRYQQPYDEYHLKMDMQILYAVSSRNLRPSLPPCCPAEILSFLNTCWNKDPDVRPDFEKIITDLRGLRIIYNERKRVWDAARAPLLDSICEQPDKAEQNEEEDEEVKEVNELIKSNELIRSNESMRSNESTSSSETLQDNRLTPAGLRMNMAMARTPIIKSVSSGSMRDHQPSSSSSASPSSSSSPSLSPSLGRKSPNSKLGAAGGGLIRKYSESHKHNLIAAEFSFKK